MNEINLLGSIKKSMIEYLEVALMQEPADAYDKGFATAMRMAILLVDHEMSKSERMTE